MFSLRVAGHRESYTVLDLLLSTWLTFLSYYIWLILRIPTQNLYPPTSCHIRWQHVSRHKSFREASPSAVFRILFHLSFKLPSWLIGLTAQGCIHLCRLQSCFHAQKQLFVSFRQYLTLIESLREVTLRVQPHHTNVFFCEEDEPQSLCLDILQLLSVSQIKNKENLCDKKAQAWNIIRKEPKSKEEEEEELWRN